MGWIERVLSGMWFRRLQQEWFVTLWRLSILVKMLVEHGRSMAVRDEKEVHQLQAV